MNFSLVVTKVFLWESQLCAEKIVIYANCIPKGHVIFSPSIQKSISELPGKVTLHTHCSFKWYTQSQGVPLLANSCKIQNQRHEIILDLNEHKNLKDPTMAFAHACALFSYLIPDDISPTMDQSNP